MENIDEEERIGKIFSDLQYDVKRAKDAKSIINDKIAEWNDLYYGRTRNKHGEIVTGSETEHRSKMQMREIAKQIEWQKPNITEPFTASKSPIEISCKKSGERARQIEKWANNEFTTEFDREEFMDQMTDIVLREGTVWIKTSWEHEERNERIVIPNATMEELMAYDRDPDVIEQNEDGTFSVEYNEFKTVRNNPDSKVCRNEHIFPDPSARVEGDMRFLAELDYMTISELKQIPGIDKDKIDSLQGMIAAEREDSSLGNVRDAEARDYGFDSSFQPKDKARKQVKIIKYYGYYDLNEDGIAEPIVAMWADKHKVNLMLEENPYPDKAIPFDRSVYSARPFSLWGNPPAFFLGELQHAKNGIMRGIFDNMSLANNNQKFVQRGTLDYVNFKRMRNGYRHIIVNKPDGITDGSFNQLPSSVFSVLQMIQSEEEQLTGIASNSQALDQTTLAKDSNNPIQLTMSQQRMSALVRNISNMLRKIIGKWITMAEVFLSDEQIAEMFNEDELVDMNAFAISKHSKVKITVGTEVNRNMRTAQLNMLMQQAKTLENNMPPEILNSLVAEMFDLFDMHEKATALRMFQPEPSEEEKAAQQLQLQNAQLENQKLQMEIGVMQKDVEARYMNAQARMMEAEANYGYKGAQTEEKLAKAQTHQIEAALKPVQVENEVIKTQKDAEKTQEGSNTK